MCGIKHPTQILLSDILSRILKGYIVDQELRSTKEEGQNSNSGFLFLLHFLCIHHVLFVLRVSVSFTHKMKFMTQSSITTIYRQKIRLQNSCALRSTQCIFFPVSCHTWCAQCSISCLMCIDSCFWDSDGNAGLISVVTQ